MLQHLLAEEDELCVSDAQGVLPLHTASAQQIVDAQLGTASRVDPTTAAWLEGAAGAEGTTLIKEAEQRAARAAFAAITVNHQGDDAARAALIEIKTPAAVRHLVGMLTAYDWEFVERAREIRGYAVAQLLELTAPNKQDKTRLTALQMLGKVTEVGLFTEKVKLEKDLNDQELDARIKERLNKFMGVVDVLSVSSPDPFTPDGSGGA